MNTLSIVLLNYNGKHHLSSFLPSVVSYSSSYEVVVVDNGSDDGSVDFVEQEFPSVKLIAFTENHGFCGGYNKAIPQIQSEYVVLLNTDVEVTERWIEPILNYLVQNPDVRAAQPKILDQKAKNRFEYAGASGGFIDTLGYPFCRGRIFQTLEVDHGQYQEPKEVFWASGSCLFIHRHTYTELGGLDEDFFAHMEEIDLCWRIWNRGFRVAVIPESTVFHIGGGTLDKSKPQKTYLNFRNGLSLLLKNEKRSSLFWKLPVRLLLDWVAIFKFSLESGFPHGFAILKAHLHFTISFFKTLNKRNAHSVNNEVPRFKGLITWAYFVKGRKKFSDLPGV